MRVAPARRRVGKVESVGEPAFYLPFLRDWCKKNDFKLVLPPPLASGALCQNMLMTATHRHGCVEACEGASPRSVSPSLCAGHAP